MIRTTITTTMLALGFVAFSGLSAMAAPTARHHQAKTAIVAQGEPAAAPASDAPKTAKADKKDKKAKGEKTEKSEKSDKGDKKINVGKDKVKVKSSTTEAASAPMAAPEKAQ